jgi:hypothetical protein
MADGYVQVAPDSSGKKLQTFENTIGGNVVEAEAVALVNTAGVALTTLLTAAANVANGQVTASTTAGTLVSSRATRRSVSVKNTDTSIAVYIGIATVTSANGMPLKPGESISIDSTVLIQVIAASGSPVVAYIETYD